MVYADSSYNSLEEIRHRCNSLNATAHAGCVFIDSGNGSSPQNESNPLQDQPRSDGGKGSTPQLSEPASEHRINNKDSNAPASIQLSSLQLHPHLDLVKLNEHSKRLATIWPKLTTEAAKEFPEFAATYNTIKQKNSPNFLGAKLTVDSALNLSKWDELLTDYHDREVVQFLRFGWPVGYEENFPPTAVGDNHQSGQHHLQHVKKFIQSELDHRALIGPFKNPPFQPWTRISPILTRPKKDSADRRIIIDLSFPIGQAVNNGIDITSIFGKDSTYVLPSITDLTSQVTQHGVGTWMWKGDLSRAYRQLRVDPLDCPLLGMQVDGKYYLDLCPSFGCRSSSAACQRTSNAFAYILAKAGCRVLAYLDDYASCAPSEEKAWHDYNTFIQTAQDLGLKLASEKCQPPVTTLEWLGFQVDSIAMTLTVPRKKLDEVLHECELWTNRSRTNKKKLQSLVGKLMHLANGIPHARKFTARLLATLRGMSDKNWITLTNEAKLDIRWFLLYASSGNGIALITPSSEYFFIECDACLTGGGGHSSSHFYRWKFTSSHVAKYKTIHALEAINLLVAYITLAPKKCKNKMTVVLLTDNIASAFALSTGKTKDQVLGSCARQMWLEAARRDQDFIIQHKPGSEIPLADALSRYHDDRVKACLADEEIGKRGLKGVPPLLQAYGFFSADL